MGFIGSFLSIELADEGGVAVVLILEGIVVVVVILLLGFELISFTCFIGLIICLLFTVELLHCFVKRSVFCCLGLLLLLFMQGVVVFWEEAEIPEPPFDEG